MENKTKLIEEAFLLGFMASREGFNAECAYDHCSPTILKPNFETEDEFRVSMNASKAFLKLRAEAVKRLAS